MHCGFGRGGIAAARGQQHARGAQRHKPLPFGHASGATGRRCVIATASGDAYRAIQPPLRKALGGELPRRIAPFNKGGHLVGPHTAFLQQLGRPCPRAHIKPTGASGVRHVHRHFSRQPVAQIILWQQHLGDTRENIRLMLGHPHKLGGRKPGKDDIAGNRPEIRVRVQRFGRLGRAGVVPQDAGPQHFASGIQQHRAVHLARQANALEPRPACPRLCPQARHRCRAGVQPIGRGLLGPASLWVRYAIAALGHRLHRAARIHQHRPQAGCAQIKAQIHDSPL